MPSLKHSNLVEVKELVGKGRGVVARVPIKKGTVIERVPVLVFENDGIESDALLSYAYVWTKDKIALAMGYGSIYNHSFKPNARYDDVGKATKVFTAIRDIAAGEEVTINYNGDPKSRKSVGFDVKD